MSQGENKNYKSAKAKLSPAKINIPQTEIAEFCHRHHICRLALFGSILRDDFRPDSDVDVLVEFEPGSVPGLLGLTGMELELSELMGGRKVDMNTLRSLSRYFRDKVQEESEVIYARV